MAEYIEREALLGKAIEEKRFIISMRDAVNDEFVARTCYKDLAEVVYSIPTADVTPVVHGEWVEHLDDMECSVCGAKWDYCDNDTSAFDFCPACGGKMERRAERKQVVDDNDLLRAMRRLRVETGSLICLGCGYEHNCGVHGCAIMRKAAQRIEELRTNEAQRSAYEPDREENK